jgi:hypothetical protein
MSDMKLRGEFDFDDDESRIQYLANLVEEGSQDASVREFTINLLNSKGVKSYDTEGEIRAIYEFARDKITYRRHVLCRDSFTTAARTLQLMSADCDQATVLTTAMAVSVGIPVGFRLVSSDINRPFHHIYGIAGVPPHAPTKWIPMDTTQKKFNLGDEPNYKKHKDYMVICGE